ncbi:MAG: uroporphyrinogen decarboxylase family protein [Promethearchaeota archaeon]
MMCAGTCPNEQNIIMALQLEEPESIPSFCQSILGKLTREFLIKYEDNIKDEDVLLTPTGDLTVYKAFGYSSRWNGSPRASIAPDDALRDRILEMNENIKKKMGNAYVINHLGSIRRTNNITSWFVEAGIKSPDDLRFFLDHWSLKKPEKVDIENFRSSRRQCMDANFVPIASENLVMEPGNQSVYFSLTARLMKKEPDLILEFYDLLTRKTELSFKAAVEAGYKIFVIADDCAYKHGPMISPKNYRKFVLPFAKRICDLIHENGGYIFMHTDGYIEPIMDIIIEAGFNGIQPLEPTSGMFIHRVKEKWGDKIACIGNVDTSYVLSFGTEKEVRENVHRCFKEACNSSKRIKGYIFGASGSLHDKVKLDNALAMMDEYKKIRDGLVSI